MNPISLKRKSIEKTNHGGLKRCVISRRRTYRIYSTERARVYYNNSYTQYNIIINCYSEGLNSDQIIIMRNSKITLHDFETNK